MARIRTLKPEFFRSKPLARCSLAARLTFQGLWVEADDYGRGDADPRVLKGSVWSLDDEITWQDVAAHLDELEVEGRIRLYEVDGERFYEIPSWEEHQAAAYRRGKAIYPEPLCDEPHDESCKDVQAARPEVLEQGTGNEEGNEERGSELALAAAPRCDPVTTVFNAWIEGTNRNPLKVQLTEDRRKRIRTALSWKYPLEDYLDACRGVLLSPHHRGENDRHTPYTDVEHVFKNPKNLEQFRDLARGQANAPPRMPTGTDMTLKNLAAIEGRNGDRNGSSTTAGPHAGHLAEARSGRDR